MTSRHGESLVSLMNTIPSNPMTDMKRGGWRSKIKTRGINVTKKRENV